MSSTKRKAIGPRDAELGPKSSAGSGLRVLSFFTGGGGLDLGFEQAGFQTVYATDIDPDSCATLKLNRGGYLDERMEVEQADITKIDPKALPQDIDLIIGGPPCQSFSASGRRAGGAAGRLDKRGMLFEAYCQIIDHVQPQAFVFENVRGILGTNKGEDWKAIVHEFGLLGYRITYRLLDALDYGAPQQRERMFLVGHKLALPFLFPEPTHGPDANSKQEHLSVGESFQGIVENENLKTLELRDGKYAYLLPEVPPGQNYLFFTAKRGYAKPVFAYRSRFSDFLYKANPHTPVKTIIASPGKYTGPLHWDNRYFSLKEYGRIQGFPDDYRFYGDRTDVIRQIGNSVSPKIAYPLALAIARQVFGRPNDVRLLDTDRVLSFDSRKGQKAKTTRALHLAISTAGIAGPRRNYFAPRPYSDQLYADGVHDTTVKCTVKGSTVALEVNVDRSEVEFASLQLRIQQESTQDVSSRFVDLTVKGIGASPLTAQAMWDAVDDWVRRSSDFHSLFELYGHFTEPHPMFSIIEFSARSKHPVAKFAAHASRFSHCSRYFPKSHLIDMFRSTLGTSDFGKIADYLRSYRFDIRSHETNIAISPNSYMVAYPFNLPARRQMNFRLKNRQTTQLLKAG